MIEVLTMGTFDLPHHGHLRLLKSCEALGKLTVGVNSDAFVEQYKGQRPIMTEAERLEFISTLGYRALLNNSPGRELIDSQNVDIIAVGSDWARKDYLAQIDVTQDWLDDRGISVIYIPYTDEISTTVLKERVWNQKP